MKSNKDVIKIVRECFEEEIFSESANTVLGLESFVCGEADFFLKLEKKLSELQQNNFLFIYIDGDYKLIQYVEAKTQEEAEKKIKDGWIRVVKIEEDMQIVYNGT